MPRSRSIPAALMLALAFAAAPGCLYPEPPATFAVPPALPRGETLDIQVYRRGTSLEMTNSTAVHIPACRMWVNQRFSREIEALGPGDSVKLPLTGFFDQFGERFRAGGFFATRTPEPVIHVELEFDGARRGLVIVANDIN